MTLDDLKLYTVQINNGSGCLFQPLLNGNEFTYILTAKHLFENGERDDDDKIIPPFPDGTEILIFRQEYVGDEWQKIPIPFTLIRGKTYFPHNDADAAILKINDLSPQFDKIVTIDSSKLCNGYFLNGFPNQFGGQIGEDYTTYSIREIEASGNYSQNAQLTNDVLNKEQIEGMSGGGILSVQEDHIYIIGIQSRVKHPRWANGKICFVPMKYFSEIINYEEFNTLLTPLHSLNVVSDIMCNKDSIPTKKAVDLRLVLFNNYKISCEPFYEERQMDKNFVSILGTNNIWIHGDSGKGKTAFLHRNLIINNISFCYCDLSPIMIKDHEQILEEIINCIELKYNLERNQSEHNRIKQIIKHCEKIDGDKFVIVIDELTTLPKDLIQQITLALSSVVIHYNNTYPDGKLKFVISTLHNPKIVTSNFSKISQYFEVIDLNDWKNNMSDLYDRIYPRLNLQGNSFKESIISNSFESPRILKTMFRKIILLPVINQQNIELVISKTIEEHF